MSRGPGSARWWLRVLALLGTMSGAATVAADAPGPDASTSPGTEYQPGPADDCQTYPEYARNLQFDGPVFVSTNIRGFPGLVFIGRDKSGQRRIYQHPSWTRAGYLAAYTYDRSGNIYVAPSPLVSLWENPPDEQNRLWKVDAQTQTMEPFVSLPPAAAPSTENPFGVLGLAYDCDTRTLYATSVMGSTPTTEKGRVFRIDLERGRPEVEVILEGQDFFGVGVRNSTDGKRLYLGSARTSGVYSVALDRSGAPRGLPEIEFYLSNFPGGANDSVKRILFEDVNLLKIKGISFHYTLKVSSAYPHSEYVFKADPGGGWDLVGIRRGLVQ